MVRVSSLVGLVSVSSLQLGLALEPPSQPHLIEELNRMIAKGNNGVYTGGKGVLIRSPPLPSTPTPPHQQEKLTSPQVDNTTKVVPAIFLVDDIQVPSIMHPEFGPGGEMCPNDGTTGFGKADPCKPDQFGQTGPWNYAQLGYVVGRNMSNVFAEFDKIQQPGWDWGVFYPTSATSETRCRWVPEYKGYDCPSYWLPWDGKIFKDVSKGGAVSFPPGNPLKLHGAGGGTGCHFATYDPQGGLDQTDALNPHMNNTNLVADPHCSCNSNLRSGGQMPWDAWVNQWIEFATPKPNFKWQAWLGAGKAKAPSFALDFAACWMNNPRDMIFLQNAIWRKRSDWSNQKIPFSKWSATASSQRSYWGWNEVPMGKDIDLPKYWDAVVIKLPVAICGKEGEDDKTSCLGANAESLLESHLESYIKAGFLKAGKTWIAHRPGSSVVFLREVRGKDFSFTRKFFCDTWNSPSGKYKVVHTNTSCFLDQANATSIII